MLRILESSITPLYTIEELRPKCTSVRARVSTSQRVERRCPLAGGAPEERGRVRGSTTKTAEQPQRASHRCRAEAEVLRSRSSVKLVFDPSRTTRPLRSFVAVSARLAGCILRESIPRRWSGSTGTSRGSPRRPVSEWGIPGMVSAIVLKPRTRRTATRRPKESRLTFGGASQNETRPAASSSFRSPRGMCWTGC